MKRKKFNIYLTYLVKLFILILFLSSSPIALATSRSLLGELKGLSGAYTPTDKGQNAITKIFSNVLGVLTIVGGLIFIIQFSLGAINWISSSGKPEKVQKAQDKMINAVIGLIAVIAAYGLAFIVGKVLGVKILDPADYITHFWD